MGRYDINYYMGGKLIETMLKAQTMGVCKKHLEKLKKQTRFKTGVLKIEPTVV